MLLDICPTLHMYETTDDKFAKGYWHWFFKILPSPYPESVIGSNPLAFWNTLARRPTHSRAVHTAEAVAAYHAAFFKPETIHATCEDYRASATIDLDHDKQDRQDGRKIAVPALRVLWGAKGMMPIYGDVVEVWKGVSDAQVEVTGTSLDCGHYIPEEQSEEVLKEIFAFLL
ncbi:hypothetical protein PLICRDRAFT_276202 [Plicaturopsis crispa FD-325 SS-3]|nr:hypothetical protein PLICRDRAFT_276202 [Plicaturopsis crispa FD-325 SS-3]